MRKYRFTAQVDRPDANASYDYTDVFDNKGKAVACAMNYYEGWMIRRHNDNLRIVEVKPYPRDIEDSLYAICDNGKDTLNITITEFDDEKPSPSTTTDEKSETIVCVFSKEEYSWQNILDMRASNSVYGEAKRAIAWGVGDIYTLKEFADIINEESSSIQDYYYIDFTHVTPDEAEGWKK